MLSLVDNSGAGPVPLSSWSLEHELHGLFCLLFSGLFGFFYIYFCLIDFLFEVYFDFVFLGVFSILFICLFDRQKEHEVGWVGRQVGSGS